MKAITLRNTTQEKNDKTTQKCFTRKEATPSDCPPVPGERYAEIDVGFPPRAGASSYPGTDRNPITGAAW
jgi:hypothetical protein